MDLLCLAGMLNDCIKQARAYPAAVRCGINVDCCFVASQPYLGIAVGAVECPAQIRAVIVECNETGAIVAT